MHTETTTPKQGRRLNMEEKRKLEHLLFSDIDCALAAYSAKRSEERGKVEQSTLSKPPKRAVQLLHDYERAMLILDRARDELEKLGYRVDSVSRNGEKTRYALRLGYSTKHSALVQYDEQTEKAKGALHELKRTYTLKLFAGGEEAKELFSALAQELALILK